MDDTNQDLAKQYQDILDRYSRELAAVPPEPEMLKPEPQTQLETLPEPAPEIQTEPQPMPPEAPPVQIPLPPELPPHPIIPQVPIPEIPSLAPAPMSPTPSKKSSGFFKLLFFISLIIFLIVLGSIIYSVYQNNSLTNGAVTPVPTTASLPSPTSVLSNVCQVNDKQYNIGETFLSADGCNTCTCATDLTIACTSKACEATPSVKLLPTIKPTLTPKATPTMKLKLTPTPIVLVPKQQTLPIDLVSVVKFNVIKDSTTAVTNNQIVIGQSILSGNFAEVAYNITNSGGAIYWLTKVGGSWQVVAGGQEPPSCLTLAKYSFPTTFSCN